MKDLIKETHKYFSLVKFAHTVFAMPFAMIGFFLAVTKDEYDFSPGLLILVILCMIFARNAAMGFNRLADRKFDSLNPRTSMREIPSGKLDYRPVAMFVAVNAGLFIAATAFINKLTFILSPVALLVILGYSLTKRFTSLCHFILGLGLSLAPVGAYISVTGAFSLLPVIYSLIVITWVSGFDIIYALQDDEFDRQQKLHSLPSGVGRSGALTVSGIVHAATALLVIWAGIEGNGSYFFWTGAAMFIGLLIYQHIIVKPGDLRRVTLAFQTTNGLASLLFAVFVITDLLVR